MTVLIALLRPLWPCLLAAAIGFSGAWKIQSYRIAAVQSDCLAKIIAAQDDARAQEVAWQINLKGVQNETNEQLNARDAAYAAAVSTIGGLRNTLANIGSGLSATTLSACRARAEALNSVFAECADQLGQMGHAAQGQLIDAVACRESWPEER